MEAITEIQIQCEGATTLPLDSLVDLQGNLKDLTEENYVKLRNSIVKYGFSFPVFVYKENDTNYILDAHQRIRTLKKMRDEGITIPDLPADFIHAENRIEAKKKLLLLNSRYGKMTREGYDEFVGDEIEDSFEEMISIPEVQMWEGNESETEEEKSGGTPGEKKEVECPVCGEKFKV